MSERCPNCGSTDGPSRIEGLCAACLAHVLAHPTAEAAVMVAVAPGDMFHGLEILEVLGQGATGVVFRARQPAMDRYVGVKVLRKDLAQGPALRRFLEEARAAARLRHENIISAYDCGQNQGSFFIVMELAEGQTLNQILKERGPLPEAEALGIARQIADALDHAWERHIVHRDVKPHNIMLMRDGTAKLCDLGLCRDVRSDVQLTQTGHVNCTPAYASPEQARGHELDTRSDIYSLGVTLYEMLTGALPFSGKSAGELFIKAVTEKPEPPVRRRPQLGAETNRLVLWMMEKDPARRPDRPAVVSAKIRSIGASEEASGSPGMPRRPVVRRPARTPSRGVGLRVAAGLGLAALAAVFALSSRPEARLVGEPREPARTEPPVAGGPPTAAPPRTTQDTRLEATLLRAEEHARRGEWPQARAAIDESLQLAPRDPRPAALREQIAAGEGDERLGRAVARGERALATGDLGEARSALREALELRPSDATASELGRRIERAAAERHAEAMRRAEESLKAREWGKARACVEEALAARPADAGAAEFLARVDAEEAAARWAESLEAARRLVPGGDLVEASQAVETLLKLRPVDAEAASLAARLAARKEEAQFAAAVAAAELHLKKGACREALEALDKALELRPGDARTLELRAKAEREARYRQAVAQADQDVGARKWDEALAGFQKALAEKPGDARAREGAARTKEAARTDPSFFREAREIRAHDEEASSVAWSPDGRTLATAGYDNLVKLWDPVRGTELRVFKGHDKDVRRVVFHPDGRSLASCSNDARIKHWDVSKATELKTIAFYLDASTPLRVSALAISPDGRLLAYAGNWRTVMVHALADYAQVHRIETEHTESITHLAFAPDGKRLAVASADGSVTVWEMAEGKKRAGFAAHADGVADAEFSPDGLWLATCGRDGLVKVTEAGTGRLRQSVKAHAGTARTLAFSHDGKMLVSGGEDGVLCFSSAVTGDELRRTPPTGAAVLRVRFAPAGRHLATADARGRVRVWERAR